MRYKYFLLMFVMVALIGMVSAEDCSPHKQNTDFELLVSSNNATSCNWTYIQFPNGAKQFYNKVMTKNGNDFNQTISSGNFSQLGVTNFGISCTDGSTIETGSICREVTPSGNSNILGFYIIIIAIVYGISFFGFFGKNVPVAMLGGMTMIILGLYTLNQGIDIFRNFMTEAFSFVTIGIGAIFAITAGTELIQENL